MLFFRIYSITEISNKNTEIMEQACIDKLELVATMGLASGEMQSEESLKFSLSENSSPTTPSLSSL